MPFTGSASIPGESGVCGVWLGQAQHSHLNIFCHASFLLCQYRVKISVSCSMSCLARRIPIGSMSVASWCSIDATSRSAFSFDCAVLLETFPQLRADAVLEEQGHILGGDEIYLSAMDFAQDRVLYTSAV